MQGNGIIQSTRRNIVFQLDELIGSYLEIMEKYSKFYLQKKWPFLKIIMPGTYTKFSESDIKPILGQLSSMQQELIRIRRRVINIRDESLMYKHILQDEVNFFNAAEDFVKAFLAQLQNLKNVLKSLIDPSCKRKEYNNSLKIFYNCHNKIIRHGVKSLNQLSPRFE